MNEDLKKYAELRSLIGLPFNEAEKCHIASTYEDIDFFLKSDKLTVDYPFRASKQVFGNTILDTDSERNVSVRKSITPFFSKSAIDHYEQVMIRPIIKTILEDCHQNNSGQIDFNYCVAERIPTQIIMEIFGIELKYERWLFKNLNPIVRYIDDPNNSLDEATKSKHELLQFLGKCLDGDIKISERGLLSSLDKKYFSDKNEILRTSLMLLTAGMATTIASLNIIVTNLYRHVDLIKSIQNNTNKIKKFIEEVIRLEPPLHATVRFAKNDFTYKDVELKKNSMIKVILASGNHDELKHQVPNDLNLETKNNHTCSFGKGRHACIGGYLALKELVIFVEEFLPLMQEYDININQDGESETEGNVIKMYKNILLEKAH